jgi:hypothetical protein
VFGEEERESGEVVSGGEHESMFESMIRRILMYGAEIWK